MRSKPTKSSIPAQVGLDPALGEIQQLVPAEPSSRQLERLPLPVETHRDISLSRCAVNGQKENPLARRRFQRGHLVLKQGKRGAVWVGRFREDILVDGAVQRVKRAEVLGDLKQYPTRRLALR